MAKHLNHKEWIEQQFESKYLRKSYRNCFIHSALIEGILVKKSGKEKFDLANKSLLHSNQINSDEFCIFNAIRKIRNSLAHRIIKSTFSQDDMDELLTNLINKIHEAYKYSKFLNKELICEYNIKRSPLILFEEKE